MYYHIYVFFFSSRRRHTRFDCDWSSDVCSSDLQAILSRGLGLEEATRVPIASTRAGQIAGTHRVGFDSVADQILLVHTARSRAGFAVGALLAARWIVGRRGMYAFADVLDDILRKA